MPKRKRVNCLCVSADATSVELRLQGSPAGRRTVDSNTLMLVGIAIVVLLLGIAAWAYMSRRRRVNLRERFGPEYERTVAAVGPARADSVLLERAERVSRFDLRKLSQIKPMRSPANGVAFKRALWTTLRAP